MKRLLLVLAVLGLPSALQAQDDEAAAGQRARIAAERSQAEATFRAQEKACHTKFAVNDCLNAAKAQRREVLADLRRQEISLNDAQRKSKAAEQLRSIEQRSSADKQRQAQGRDKALGEHREREGLAARKAAERASADASRPARAAAQQDEVARKQAEASADRGRRAEEAAQNVKRRNERLAQTQERKASRDKRLAERRKPLADPLPEAPP
jgi:colicin import membrane protein